MSDVRQEMDQVINELEKKGIDFNTTHATKNGLAYKNVIVPNVKNI